MKVMHPFWVLLLTNGLLACALFSGDDDKPLKRVPPKAATGKNFRMAVKICERFGGVSFVESGEKFSAECRDGLQISRRLEKKKNDR